jgi:archaea-specific RecJ-like exonuclease
LKAFCISHAKDVDGLASAAMAMAATGGESRLVDYEDVPGVLDEVPEDAGLVVISDLGVDNDKADEFVEKIGRLAARARVTYIDHHYLPESTKKRLAEKGVKVVHDVRECASMLTYETFRGELPGEAKLVALCGAVTDYMDDSPMASRLMEQSDRHYVLLEATMLAYALSKKGESDHFPEKVARHLSLMKPPHELKGVAELAVAQLDDTVKMARRAKREGRKIGRLAWMVTTQHSTGNVAKLLVGAFGVPLGVAMKQKQPGWYEVSLRGTSECKIHLGRTLSSLAGRLGGSGGGHKLAAGCRIPAGAQREFLKELARRV